MKLTAQQYHKQKKAQHDWVCTYVDVQTGKEVKFTCSNAMKKSHAILMQDNPWVKQVEFKKGGVK